MTNNYTLYASLKRRVFNWDLKLSVVDASLSSCGSLFHNVGAENEKALSPYLTDLVLGMSNISIEFDLKHLLFFDTVKRSAMYEGAIPWRALYVKSRILYSTRLATGSQWSSLRIGVMCSPFFVLVTTLAAAFCILWSLPKCCLGTPNNNPLKLSSLDDTKLCIRVVAADESK